MAIKAIIVVIVTVTVTVVIRSISSVGTLYATLIITGTLCILIITNGTMGSSLRR